MWLFKGFGLFERVCAIGEGGRFSGKFPIAAHFRWLTPIHSTVVQTSPPDSGWFVDVSGNAQVSASAAVSGNDSDRPKTAQPQEPKKRD